MGIAKLAGIAVLIAAVQVPPFQIESTHLPVPVSGEAYQAQLQAVGGTPPYHWTVLHPSLPPGLHLDEATGAISGTLHNAGPFSVLVQVADSAEPPLVVTRLLPTGAGAPLALTWNPAPAATTDGIAGGVEVNNSTGDEVAVTVIVEAVNEVGKAFALRYDHESLPPQASTPNLAFQVSMPPGHYVVHVDAVGEVAATGAIYRDRLEQTGIVIPGG